MTQSWSMAPEGSVQATYQRPFVEWLAQKANGSGALRAKSVCLFAKSGDEDDGYMVPIGG